MRQDHGHVALHEIGRSSVKTCDILRFSGTLRAATGVRRKDMVASPKAWIIRFNLPVLTAILDPLLEHAVRVRSNAVQHVLCIAEGCPDDDESHAASVMVHVVFRAQPFFS